MHLSLAVLVRGLLFVSLFCLDYFLGVRMRISSRHDLDDVSDEEKRPRSHAVLHSFTRGVFLLVVIDLLQTCSGLFSRSRHCLIRCGRIWVCAQIPRGEQASTHHYSWRAAAISSWHFFLVYHRGLKYHGHILTCSFHVCATIVHVSTVLVFGCHFVVVACWLLWHLFPVLEGSSRPLASDLSLPHPRGPWPASTITMSFRYLVISSPFSSFFCPPVR